MKTALCQCGKTIYFENTQCISCHSELGFLTDLGTLSALEQINAQQWRGLSNQQIYRKCRHYSDGTGCNWMIPDDDPETLCLSCRLSEVIPDQNKQENIVYWHRIEQAKRRLVYSLYNLGLPLKGKRLDPDQGLAFHLMEDHEHYSEFASDPTQRTQVFTGHVDGVITVNVAEADPILRETARARMQERYRTLLGHLRHESGHYYWERLVGASPLIDEFREIFGDERKDYAQALQLYYDNGPRADWANSWISAYASSHPWEDWAECWAHYLHMIDAMETAHDFASEIYQADAALSGQRFDRALLERLGIDRIMEMWAKLAEFLNEMNRSLGLDDAYPFYLSNAQKTKMKFIHKVVCSL